MDSNLFLALLALSIIAIAAFAVRVILWTLPMAVVRRISERERGAGKECFFVRFRYPLRNKALMCFDDLGAYFYKVSITPGRSEQPFLRIRKGEFNCLEKISRKKTYRFPFKGTDQRFRPARDDLKFSYSGKDYAITLFGKYEKVLAFLSKNES